MDLWKCRACSSSYEDKESAVEAEKYFQEKKWIYSELTTFKVLEKDGLPQSICTKCTSLLDQFKEFKNTCVQSIEEFQKLAIKQENNEEFAFADTFQDFDGEEVTKAEVKYLVEPESDQVSGKRIRKSTDSYLCPEEGCKKRFRKLKLLESHQRNQHDDDDEDSDEAEAPVKRSKKEKIIRDFVCSFKGCKRRFLSVFNRDAHFQTHENGGKLCCLICSRPFNDYNNLNRHMSVHESKEERKDRFTCTFCQRNYSNVASFKAHLQSHEGQQHVCEECGKIFDSSAKLRTHKPSHALPVPKECDECGESFESKTKYWKHKIQAHRPKITKKETCIVCGKVCVKKRLMEHCRTNHTVYTTTDNIHACHLCAQKFKTLDGLKVHVNKHTNERKHACQLCPKKFFTSSALKKHGYFHSGERPVHCDICNKGFYQKCALDIHMNVHRRQWIAEGQQGITLHTYPQSKKKDSEKFSDELE